MTNTTTEPTAEELAEMRREALTVANEIKRQIGRPLMNVGAHDFLSDYAKDGSHRGALTFKARIIPKGLQAPRIMRVTVTLTHADTYHVEVIWSRTTFGPIETHFEMDDVYAEDLPRVILSLDKEG